VPHRGRLPADHGEHAARACWDSTSSNLNPGYRLARMDDVLDDLLDLLSYLRHHFAYGMAQMIVNRDAAYFRQI
jgi:hypothetical protein